MPPMSSTGGEEARDCSDGTLLRKESHICTLLRLVTDLKAHFIVF